MQLIVQKFGGSSVADPQRMRHVASLIADTYKAGYQVVVVLSAQGDTTDQLLEKASAYAKEPPLRELDMLLSTGEQMSVALCAMTLEEMGISAVSLTGEQAGICTSGEYGNAVIRHIHTERIWRELAAKRVVLVTGFQGMNEQGDVTTLGRGGSDTSAVALAIALQADLCQIYTDVDGVYTADPRQIPGARRLKEITRQEMLALAGLGAKVLHDRSVELAQQWGVPLEVRSSMEQGDGTRVVEQIHLERPIVTGVTKHDDIARLTVPAPGDEGVARMMELLREHGICVEAVVYSGNNSSLGLTLQKEDCRRAAMVLELAGISSLQIEDSLSRISAVGERMLSTAGVAAEMLSALAEAEIPVLGIVTGQLCLSVLVERKNAALALRAVHDKMIHP